MRTRPNRATYHATSKKSGPAAGISKGRIHANPCGERVRIVSSRVDRCNETGTSVLVETTVLAGRVRPNRAADPRHRPDTATSDAALCPRSRNTLRQGPGVHAGGKKVAGERRRRMGAGDDRPGFPRRRFGVSRRLCVPYRPNRHFQPPSGRNTLSNAETAVVTRHQTRHQRSHRAGRRRSSPVWRSGSRQRGLGSV